MRSPCELRRTPRLASRQFARVRGSERSAGRARIDAAAVSLTRACASLLRVAFCVLRRYAAWKLREMRRLKRDLEKLQGAEMEKAETLRRRGLSDKERRKEDEELVKLGVRKQVCLPAPSSHPRSDPPCLASLPCSSHTSPSAALLRPLTLHFSSLP